MSEAVDTKKNKESVGEFIANTRDEMKKTSFPSSEDVRNTTLITIAFVIFFTLYLFLVDKGWVYILEGVTWSVNKIAGL